MAIVLISVSLLISASATISFLRNSDFTILWVGVGEGVKDPACLSMTTESLTREFPLYTPSLLNLVKTSETRVKGLGPEQ